MLYTVIIIAIIVLPAITLTLLKTNATVTFLSLCTGFVLLGFIAEDATLVASTAVPHAGPAVISTVHIAIILLPAALSAIVLSRSLSGSRLLVNLIPAIAFGLLAALLVIPLLPGGVRHNLMQTQVWIVLDNAKSLIAGGGILLSLMTLWLSSKKHEKHGKKH